MKKILSLTLALVMLLSGFHTVFAGWDGFVGEDEAYTVLDTSNVLKIINSGAAPVDNGPDMENNTSIYWAHTGSSPQIRILSAGSYDFSEYKKLRMQMFSAEKTNSKIAFVCGKASGGYYFYSLDINWVGWKEIKIPLEKFSMNGSGVSGWHDITYIDIYAHGWNMTPNPKTVLYINTVYLEKEESNSSIAVDEKLLKKLLDESVCFYADRNQYLDKNQVKYYQSTPSYESDGICYVASDEIEACLGKAVTVDKETMKVSIDGKITDIIGIESDGTMYASVADVAKAMGKNTVVYKNLVVVSDNKAVNDVKRNTKMLDEMAKSTTQNSVDPTTITEEDMKFTLRKWENYLTGGGASEHSQAKNAKAAETARDYQNSMNKTDDAVILWGNAPCESTAQMRTQYTNLRNMAIAWATPGTEAYHDEQLKEDILFGIEWGYENLFGEDEIKNEGWRDTGIYNWYEWQIGVPHDLSIICMLLRDEIPSAEMKKYLKPVDYFTNERFGSLINTNNRGANIADTAYPFIISQLLQNNADMVNKAVNIIVRDLDYSYKEAEDGQHTDGSYRFHYYYAMNGTYGLAFMSAVVPIINIMNDTKFEIIDCNIDRYAEWMFKAYETSVYNGRMMSVFRGRSPGGEASTGTSAISNMLEFSEVLNKSDRTRMQSMLKYFGENGYISENSLNEAPYNILKRIFDDDTIKPRESIKDFNMFYNTDKAVWQNDDYAMAISMNSSRTSGWESINGENKKGWYQGDGMVYLYTNDDASTYEDSFWKNVNYYRLPGTTVDTQERAAESIQDQRVYQSSQSFVGGVELGEKYGVAAMLLESCHNETSDGYTSQYGNALPIHHNDLMAQKSYFVFDDEMVHLGAGINSTMNFDVETIVENRKAKKTMNLNPNTIESYEVVGVTASEEPQDENPAINVIDGDFGTRWSAENVQNIVLDLGEVKTVGMVGVAVMNGTTRTTDYDISLSADGVEYTKLYEGGSSGTTDFLEVYDMKKTEARYVKLDCYGNSQGSWNSITEITVYPPTVDGSLEIPEGIYKGTETIIANGNEVEAGHEEESVSNVSWANMEGSAGYVFLKPVTLGIRKTNTNPSFNEMWIKHGKNPVNDTYAYVTLPLKSAEETKAYSENPQVEIIANDEKLQAVKETSLGITGMVFWEKGTCGGITVDRPCIVMLKEAEGCIEISVSDPTHEETEIKLTLDFEGITLDEENSSVFASFKNGVLIASTVENDGKTISAKFYKNK